MSTVTSPILWQAVTDVKKGSPVYSVKQWRQTNHPLGFSKIRPLTYSVTRDGLTWFMLTDCLASQPYISSPTEIQRLAK